MRYAWLLAALAVCTVASDADAKKKKKHASKLPPVAFYVAEYGSVKAATREEATRKCEARRADEKKKHPELAGYRKDSCAETVVVVRGPYDRRGQRDPYDDPKIYVYRGSDGVWYDANGETSCFVAGTPIATPDGAKPIESLREGDVVWSWSFEENRPVRGVVEKTKRRAASRVETLTLAGGTHVTATPNHPFYSAQARAFVELGALHDDDAVLVLDGASLTARPLPSPPTTSEGDFAVWDLSISPERNYFAAGVLVHNY